MSRIRENRLNRIELLRRKRYDFSKSKRIPGWLVYELKKQKNLLCNKGFN